MSAPKTHDYTVRYWGHDYMIVRVAGLQIRLVGWGRGISAGDYMLLQNGDSGTRYQVRSIKYRSNPPDMWSADLDFAPRSQEVPA